MPRIALMMPYYGAWPSYFPLYLTTCAQNAQLDFIFFTDLEVPKESPANVHFHRLPFQNLRERAEDKLETYVNLPIPFKICDIRPAFAKIFSEYIEDYDYWGWGDIDVIYGELLKGLSEEMLSNSDIISGRKKWLSGSFCIMKNTEVINDLYKSDNDYQRIFADASYWGFDECGRQWKSIREADSILDIPHDISNITWLAKKLESEGVIRTYFDDHIKESIKMNSWVKWDQNLTDSSQNQYWLYHFITEKRHFKFQYPRWDTLPKKFYISQSGFYTQDEFESWYKLLDLSRTIIGGVKASKAFLAKGLDKLSNVR